LSWPKSTASPPRRFARSARDRAGRTPPSPFQTILEGCREPSPSK
jgi:hypothetical protein